MVVSVSKSGGCRPIINIKNLHYCSTNSCLCCTFQSSLTAVWMWWPISIWDPRGSHQSTLRPHLLHIRPPCFQWKQFRASVYDLGLPGMASSTDPILEPTIFAFSSPPDPPCVPIHCLSVIREGRGRTRCCRRYLLQGERSHNAPLSPAGGRRPPTRLPPCLLPILNSFL